MRMEKVILDPMLGLMESTSRSPKIPLTISSQVPLSVFKVYTWVRVFRGERGVKIESTRVKPLSLESNVPVLAMGGCTGMPPLHLHSFSQNFTLSRFLVLDQYLSYISVLALRPYRYSPLGSSYLVCGHFGTKTPQSQFRYNLELMEGLDT